VALDSAFPYARDWLHFPEQLANEGLQPHKVEEVWLMATTAPDYCVDVTAVWERKIAARHAHASQVADRVAHAAGLRARDERLGAEFGVTLGEVFKRIKLPD
jgi:LmbE family N-acetylglucosaminyl deacetylase